MRRCSPASRKPTPSSARRSSSEPRALPFFPPSRRRPSLSRCVALGLRPGIEDPTYFKTANAHDGGGAKGLFVFLCPALLSFFAPAFRQILIAKSCPGMVPPRCSCTNERGVHWCADKAKKTFARGSGRCIFTCSIGKRMNGKACARQPGCARQCRASILLPFISYPAVLFLLPSPELLLLPLLP